MAQSFSQLFSPEVVVALIQQIEAGVPAPLPDAAYASKRFVLGNTAEYGQLFGSRKTARLVGYTSASAASSHEQVGRNSVTLLHTAEHFLVEPWAIGLGLSWGQAAGGITVPDLGVQEYTRRLAEQKQKCVNLRRTAVHLALATGYIYWDSAGNILPDSTGSIAGVDFGIPAANRTQFQDVDGNTIISASWATAATDIVSQVKLLKTTCLKRTGRMLDTVVYGSNILGYMLGNTSIANLLNGNPAQANSFLAQEIPAGFLGIQNWIPGDSIFFVDADGDYQSIVGADALIAMPAFGADWFEVVEGTTPCPTTLGGGTSVDPMAALASIEHRRGLYAYPELQSDPAGLKTVVGDTHMPVVNVANALYIGDVTP